MTDRLDAGILKKTVGEGNSPNFFHRVCIQTHLDCVNMVEPAEIKQTTPA